MNISQRKEMRNRMNRGYEMTFEDAVKNLFHADDHDALARDLGYEDRHQMFFYENQVETNDADTIARACGYENARAITEELNRMEMEEAMRHREIERLAKVDSREVYSDPPPLHVTNSFYERMSNAGCNTRNIRKLDK